MASSSSTRLMAALTDKKRESSPGPSSSPKLSKLIDKNKISELAIVTIFKYLSDSDLSNLAVNKEFANRTLSDSRWTEKLTFVLFNGLYLNHLLNELGDGRPIAVTKEEKKEEEKDEEKKEENIEKIISTKVHAFILFAKGQGITHFQTIYARYRKLQDINGSSTLDEDQFILLSNHPRLIKNWLERNRNIILRNESLSLSGLSPIFYLAISGYSEGLRLYHQLGYDSKLTNIDGEGIQGCVALSGNVSALGFCANELKLDMNYVNRKGIGLQHLTAKSGSTAALLYSKTHLKLNVKALTKNKVGVQHMAAFSGNPDAIRLCDKEFKLPMRILTSQKLGVQHYAARSGSSESIVLCKEMKLDLNLIGSSGRGIQHLAAASGKSEALKTCQKLGLDMGLYSKSGFGVQHSAAQGGIGTLRFCRDIGLDMKAVTKGEQVFGIQHILADRGTADDFRICSELGLNLEELDKKGQGVEIHAAESGNSSALRFFKKIGIDMLRFKEASGIKGAAAYSGDPLTILTCEEWGLEIDEEPRVRLMAQLLAAHSKNPAALLVMQLLGVQMDDRINNEAKESENPTVGVLAKMVTLYSGGHPYPPEMKAEWDKIVFENVIEHIAGFFNSMSKKTNTSILSDGFFLSPRERRVLQELAYQIQTMKENNLSRVFIYLNYFLVDQVNSKKVKLELDVSFTAIIRYATDQTLNKIHELKAARSKIITDVSTDRRLTK